MILDVSRLLTCIGRLAPTGIDCVEQAYAERWLARPEAECTFAAQSVWGWFAALPRQGVADLVAGLDAAWTRGEGLGRARAAASRLLATLALGSGRAQLRRIIAKHDRCVFLLVSHRALDRPGPILALRDAGARFVPMIHDLIPLTHPEFQRAKQQPRHAARVKTTAQLADGVIVNSAATAAVLGPYLQRPGRQPPPVSVALLGLRVARAATPDLSPLEAGAPEGPYFVALGTVEPRKNHQLLLHIWGELPQHMRDQFGGAPPSLLILGRRGWEIDRVVAMLDRSDRIRGHVVEMGPVDDRRAAALLRGARALLFPSFAEGYGLPVAEALALGTPVICSDLPALREVGGQVPDYLEPMDGPAWRRAILDYARPDSPGRATQLGRLQHWSPPGWDAHFRAVDALLARVTREASGAALGRGTRSASLSPLTARDLPGQPEPRAA